MDDLREHRARPPAPTFVQADEATWRKYAHCDRLKLRDLVLLHSRVDARFVGRDGFREWVDACRKRRSYRAHMESLAHLGVSAEALPAFGFTKERMELTADDRLYLNYERALEALEKGELKKSPIYSRLIPFYSDEASVVEVEDFHAWATEVGLPVVEGPWPERGSLDGPNVGVVYRFPYRTKWLDRLEELAWQAVKLSKGGWLTSARFVELARSRRSKLSRNLAEVFATILRRDDARLGRPPHSQD